MNVEKLTILELQTALRFMLAHMRTTERMEMMRSLPIIYAKIYPDTVDDVLTAVGYALEDIKLGIKRAE